MSKFSIFGMGPSVDFGVLGTTLSVCAIGCLGIEKFYAKKSLGKQQTIITFRSIN